jgi:hypothetical protein
MMDPAQPPAQQTEPVYRFDASRWNYADRVTGAATLALVISLFLPWFTVSANVPEIGEITRSGDGFASHGYLYVAFPLALLILAYLTARAGLRDERMPGFPHEGLLAIATGINFVLVLLGVLLKPSAGSGISEMFDVRVDWSYGSLIALGAAAVAFASVARRLR